MKYPKKFIKELTKTYYKKKVLVTGHTGFKGSWLTLWLNHLGANVMGVSIDHPTKPSHYKLLNLEKKIKSKKIDVRNFKLFKNAINKFKPDFIFHLAAQSMVKKSYTKTIETWETNLMGTLNLLELLKSNKKKKIITVIITSDKCYKNVETKKGYKESDKLAGEDPYGASKSAAEIAFNSYVKSFFNKKINKNLIVTARAGNVIGGGDWTEDRLIPDCIKSCIKSRRTIIRNPYSTRPWQHVLDVIYGYLILASKLKKNKKLHGQSFNFGPNKEYNYRVIDVLKKSKLFWRTISWNIIKNKSFKENSLLNLDNSKAKKILKCKPNLTFDKSIKMTIEWYKFYTQKNKNITMREKSLKQISEFCENLKT